MSLWPTFHLLRLPPLPNCAWLWNLCLFSAFSVSDTNKTKRCRYWMTFTIWYEEKNNRMIFTCWAVIWVPHSKPFEQAKDRWPKHCLQHATFWNSITTSCSTRSRSGWWVIIRGQFYMPSDLVTMLLSHSLVHLVCLWVFFPVHNQQNQIVTTVTIWPGMVKMFSFECFTEKSKRSLTCALENASVLSSNNWDLWDW